MIFEHEFKGRKPSNQQVLKQVNEAIRQNCRVIQLNWGENWIELQQMPNRAWLGSGWIRNISGYELAIGLNNTNKFIKNHFHFVHIGA